ncbi:MAG: hypothetical protein R3F60_06995 [bacterium]
MYTLFINPADGPVNLLALDVTVHADGFDGLPDDLVRCGEPPAADMGVEPVDAGAADMGVDQGAP